MVRCALCAYVHHIETKPVYKYQSLFVSYYRHYTDTEVTIRKLNSSNTLQLISCQKAFATAYGLWFTLYYLQYIRILLHSDATLLLVCNNGEWEMPKTTRWVDDDISERQRRSYIIRVIVLLCCIYMALVAICIHCCCISRDDVTGDVSRNVENCTFSTE